MATDLARRKELGLIHAAKKALAIEESSYRALLARVTGKESAADLDAGQRSKVIDELRRLGFRYEPHKRRSHSAAVAPLVGKIRALWMSLWELGEIPDAGAEALAGFIRLTAKVDAERFLTIPGANRVIEGLKARCARAGFAQPTPDEVAAIDGWRAQAGKPAGGTGFAARAKLIEAQWQRLIALGAMQAGAHARLDTWLMARFDGREPHWLSPAHADRAIEQLGTWIRRVKANHRDTEAQRGEPA